MAGPPPLYGMWFIRVPARLLNSSPARCGELPAPEDAMLSCPGFSFASAMRSFNVFTGTEGCTTTTFGVEVRVFTVMKSRTTSYPGFAYRLMLIACAMLPMSIV